MKPTKRSLLLGLLCFVLGAGSMFAMQHFLLNKNQRAAIRPLTGSSGMNPFFDRFFDDGFFGKPSDPFDDMRRMRESMLKQFDHEAGGGLFDSWYKQRFGGGSAGDVTRREDNHFVYYDISVKGLKDDKVRVKVENGNISLSGQAEQKSEDGSSYTSSSFHRSFPVPGDVDASKVEIQQGKGTLVLKFPKLG